MLKIANILKFKTRTYTHTHKPNQNKTNNERQKEKGQERRKRQHKKESRVTLIQTLDIHIKTKKIGRYIYEKAGILTGHGGTRNIQRRH